MRMVEPKRRLDHCFRPLLSVDPWPVGTVEFVFAQTLISPLELCSGHLCSGEPLRGKCRRLFLSRRRLSTAARSGLASKVRQMAS